MRERMVWLQLLLLCSFMFCIQINFVLYLCMWTVRIVWLRLLCSFMLCVPIARFLRPSSNTANRSSSSAHSILDRINIKLYVDNIYRQILKKLCQKTKIPEKVIYDKGSAALVPTNCQVGAFCSRVKQVNNLEKKSDKKGWDMIFWNFIQDV